MNIRRIGILFLVLLTMAFLYYHYIFASTIMIATLEEKIEIKNSRYIKIRSEDNRTIKIKVPKIVWPFLDEGSEYSVGYKQNQLRSPFLTYLSPIDKNNK